MGEGVIHSQIHREGYEAVMLEVLMTEGSCRGHCKQHVLDLFMCPRRQIQLQLAFSSINPGVHS